MSETRIEGLSDLYKTLQTLPAKIEGNIMRGALRAAQGVIRKSAMSMAPVDDGHLKKSIKIKFRARSQKFGVIRMHLTAGDKNAYYAHMIEFGTASFYTGKGKTVGKPYIIKAKDSTGAELSTGNKRRALKIGATMVNQVTHPGIRPRPFMRPAFDQSKDQALKVMADYIKTRIPKELKKVGR